MDQFSNLSRSVKIVIVTLVVICIAGAAYWLDPRAMPVVLGGLLLVGVMFGLYLLAIRIMRKRQGMSMGGHIAQHSAVAPRGISEPARRAQLDNLRQNFQKGLERFRAAGKDLYSLPWYLVVGEPGSGKTEAIRHCNVGFPPGLQDELQGAGGTINMHWWFTNYAVIIDTAGRLMFEEVPPGSTSEWREFLGLMRKSRPNCPINGLVLVIPSDSLIKDTADAIAKKASRIATQLSTIQTVLDVRFPVFVVVTKCDLINGFREFFNSLNDPHLQHQMLGWSNPDELDQPFRPELVDKHLDNVVSRIRRRRLGMMQDPTPQTDLVNGRRLDDVDALFSLPSSMALLAPRLKRYLEMIFVPNEWSGKPLFLRGIYFSSAMREGEALDLELAEAIGVPVDSLSEGKVWEKERAYFLRDLFLGKIFKERGLVTRATNTRRMLRKRQAVLFGCGFVGLFLLLSFSWIGARALRESVGRERDFWLAASDGWQPDGSWHPIVSPEFKGSTSYVFNGDQAIKVGNDEIKLAEFHHRLAELSESDIRVPLVFKPMSSMVAGANKSRRKAQRIVFESGVVAPLVQAAREKLKQSADQWNESSSATLALMIRLEGSIQNRESGLTSDDLSAAGFFKPLDAFLYNSAKPDPDLNAAFDWVYVKAGDGRGYWPPRWLSAGPTLNENKPIAEGLTAFAQHLRDSQKKQTDGFEHIKNVRTQLKRLKEREEDLSKLASQRGGGFSTEVDNALSAVLTQKEAVDKAMKEAAGSGFFDTGKLLLASSYQTLVEATRKETETAFRLFQAELEKIPAPTDDKGPVFTLPAEIRRRLAKEQSDIKTKTEGTFSGEEIAELAALDKLFLDRNSAGDPIYSARAALYQETAAQLRDTGSTGDPLVGAFEKNFSALQKSIATVREKAARYQGAFSNEFAAVARRTLESAEAGRVQSLFTRYFDEMDERLRRQAVFPFVLGGTGTPMTLPAVRDVGTLLQLARTDVAAMKGAAVPATFAARVDALDARLRSLAAVGDALLMEEGRPATVTVTLLKFDDQRRQIMKQLGTEEFASKFIGNVWRTLRFGTQKVRTEARETTSLGRLPVSDGTLRIDFFKAGDDSDPDRNFAINAPWAPLQLLQQPFVRRLPGGKEWEIMLSLKDDTGQERYVLLLLQFEKSLPEIDQWPTPARLGLDRR